MSEPVVCPYCGLADHTGREHLQFVVALSPAVCHFRPSKPPWPSQMCALCGEWLDDHNLPVPCHPADPAGGTAEVPTT